MPSKNFAVFDSDSHVVESPALWEKYLDPEYRTLGKHALWRQEGRAASYLKVNGEIFRDRGNSNLPRHALWRPGMTWDAIGELDTHTRHPINDGAGDPRGRLSDMDAMRMKQKQFDPDACAEDFFVELDTYDDHVVEPAFPGGGGGPFAGGSSGAPGTTTFTGSTPLGHPLAPILAPWLDNHMFVAATLIGFTVMERYPGMKVVVAHGKASWMQEVLEKMEASTRVIPLLHHYPVSTEPEEMWEHSNVMLGFDAEERLIQKLPHYFAAKVVWGSRYPHHDATSAWDALALLRGANVPEPLIARMMGQNAAAQFGVELAAQTAG